MYANIIKNKLNKHYDNIIGEEQNVFQKGRSCCDRYFTMKILIEKNREFNTETHIAFVHFKKAFDRVNSKELLRILVSDQVPQQTIQNIYIIYIRQI
jgi:RNase P protein component